MRLHRLLENQAQKNPDAIAIVDGEERVSYRRLNEMADQVAAHLGASGVSQSDRVALWMEKTAATIAALFGILKSGACYVPIDPRAPVLRAASLIETTKPVGVITSPANIQSLKDTAIPLPSCLVPLSGGLPLELPQPPALKPVGHDAEAAGGSPLAYILFTSGSTGMPKGVMISHDAAMSFVRWAAEYFQLSPGDVVSSHAPLHFDLSTFDIFSSVMGGATIALVPAKASLFPASLGKWIASSRITVWYSVPSVLIHLVERGGFSANAFPSLRALLFAGEVLPPRNLRPLMALAPNASLFNLYGPTETNVCTFHKVEDPADGAPIPIGAPCPYCHMAVLDEALAPVKPGEQGELCVGGSSLMEGYWQRPDETARRVIPDPRDSAQRLYRTGDTVRLDSTGVFHFVGRRDHQIKLHGYRIEPAEIETALDRHPGVKSSAVLADGEKQGHQELVAFIVPRDRNGGLDRGVLVEHCTRHLPPHMVPRRYIFMDEFPETSTGKLDRGTLRQSLSRGEKERDPSHAR